MDQKKPTLAQQALKQFEKTNIIPQLGQRIHEGMGPGSVHVFPDGSMACHWTDGAYTLAELSE